MSKPDRRLQPQQTSIDRIVDAAAHIFDQPDPDDLDRAFLARQLVQVTLPHSDPGADKPAWSRTNGNLSITIRAGWNHQAQKSLGYPYGSIPRLLLFWLNTEAVRTKSPRIELGDSLSAFMREIGLNPDNGSMSSQRSDARRLRNQMERLFRATMSLDTTVTEGEAGARRGSSAWLDMQVAPKGMFWWDEKHPEQPALWGSWIELSAEFFKAITDAPVPLDYRAIAALKRSPLALDVYAWAVYRSFTVTKRGKPSFIPWKGLSAQLGAQYSDPRNFRRSMKEALRKVQAIYPALKIEDVPGGVRIHPSPLHALPSRPQLKI